MSRYAAFALAAAAFFLIAMAVLTNSSPLFYMGTAMVATLAAARIQAHMAVRWLRFERFVTPSAAVGEPVTVEIIVWSERRIKRPLVTVTDALPRSLVHQMIRPPLPIAPSFDQPIRTRYSFRPMRRGRFRWSKLNVRASDALGLLRVDREHTTEPAELTVYPTPIPLEVEINPTAGAGITELEAGRVRGAGMEPHGIRDYAPGDPLRFIHWRSSAKRDRLVVKEFDAGTGVRIAFLIQDSRGTDFVDEDGSSLDAMCGNALFLAEHYIERGAELIFPTIEAALTPVHPEARIRQVREILTDIRDQSNEPLGSATLSHRAAIPEDATIVFFVGVADDTLPATLATLADHQRVVVVYDPAEFGAGTGVPRASDPSYLGRIEATGTRVIHAPRQRRAS